jgi:hypothetical protein
LLRAPCRLHRPSFRVSAPSLSASPFGSWSFAVPQRAVRSSGVRLLDLILELVDVSLCCLFFRLCAKQPRGGILLELCLLLKLWILVASDGAEEELPNPRWNAVFPRGVRFDRGFVRLRINKIC